jgi:para-nitrobenzyl esterase
MDDVVVRVEQGRLRGVPCEHGYRFLGIPYARPPAETGRFAAPQPARPWDGVRNAYEYGATALQLDHGVTLAREPLLPGDDCLNLNVFTPALGAAGLPVLFWVHGGGFCGGCNASPWYVGTKFARDGVVLVSINYRLGAEGFMLLRDAPPNRGVLDWIAALEWVHENVSAFGGDPSKVTIAGQSSGGGACASLLAVPRARGLFRGSICMSGSAGLEMNTQTAEDVAASMAAIAGVKATKQEFDKISDKALLSAQAEVLSARSGTSDKLAALDAAMEGAYLPFAPVVDGEVMSETILQAASRSDNKHIALMVGTTENEFKTSMRDRDWLNSDVLREALLRSTTRPDLAERYLVLHRSDSPADTAGQIMTDRGFRVPAHLLLESWYKAGGTGFAYEFRWSPSEGNLAGLSAHVVDLPFAFDLLGVEGSEEVAGADPPQNLADVMHSSFVSLARDMSPGWREYTSERPTHVFDISSHIEYNFLELELGLWR